MYDFYVGQPVICVDSSPHAELQGEDYIRDSGLAGLEIGSKYHIRWIGKREDMVLVKLTEIIRKKNPWTGIEYSFFAFRFRPLNDEEKKRDRGIFHKLVNKLFNSNTIKYVKQKVKEKT